MIHCVKCGAEIPVDPLTPTPATARCALCARDVPAELPGEPGRISPVIFELGDDGVIAGFEGNF